MNIFVTGGAGYVGGLLVPELLKEHKVIVYDMFLYNFKFGEHQNLVQVKGDIRDKDNVISCSKDCDVIIHLASTGAPGKIEAKLAESINYKATNHIISACKTNHIKRLIVASSTSQYGVKPLDVSVDEDEVAEPVDDYGLYKIMSEKLISESDMGDTEFVFVRPSTLCGYAPRLRLDLAVNALTINALVNGRIKVFGGEQMRPTLNINDMVRFYKLMLTAPKEKIDRKAFNVLYGNKTINELALMVKKVVGGDVGIDFLPSDDKRSYHVNADRMKDVLGFECKFTLEDGVRSLIKAYNKGLIPNALTDSVYRNADRFQEVFGDR